MKIKHQELLVDKENPFLNCKLDRKQYAVVLTNIVKSYADGFVLAINNDWGTGKSTFVKMWEQKLKNEGFQTIYFNAWENDFDSNPLVAIISELQTLANTNNEEVFKSVIKKGAVLIKNTTPAILKALIKKYIDTDAISDILENTAKAGTEILEEEIKEYAEKKKTIIHFRDDLKDFIEKKTSNLPLIFIIDELDRCRPDYAVEVLEQMKHFFSVKGVVFILSMDKKHLASSICGFYGSENINTDEYLRRFIDLEYSLPKPSNKAFIRYLFEYYGFNDFFFSEERKLYKELSSDSGLLLDIAELLFENTIVTLRQQEKILGQTRLIINSFKSNQYSFPHVLIILVFIKTIKNDLYQQIDNNIISVQDLCNRVSELMPSEKRNTHNINLTYVIAMLLHFYNNNEDFQYRMKLFQTEPDGKITSSIKSKLENERSSLASCFSRLSDDRISDTNLKYLLNKINLIEPFATI